LGPTCALVIARSIDHRQACLQETAYLFIDIHRRCFGPIAADDTYRWQRLRDRCIERDCGADCGRFSRVSFTRN